jgi:hypothetical protein
MKGLGREVGNLDARVHCYENLRTLSEHELRWPGPYIATDWEPKQWGLIHWDSPTMPETLPKRQNKAIVTYRILPDKQASSEQVTSSP